MIPFYRPYFSWPELLAALGLGEGQSDFESAVASKVGARYGIAFAFGRSGVIAFLKAMELKQTEVVLPAYTCEVIAEVILYSGNNPAFVDIKLRNYNMDISMLRKTLTNKTRVVVATHLFGYPTNVDEIRSVIGDDRITILEDCAQSMLTFSPGTNELRGDLGLFSFGPHKPLCTIQGGVIVTNSPDLYERIKDFRDKEMSRSSIKVWIKRWAWLLTSYFLFNKSTYGLYYLYRYRPKSSIKIPSKNNISLKSLTNDITASYLDFQARIGLTQLNRLDDVLSKRRALAELYNQELQNVPNIYPAPIVKGATYSFYIIRVPRRDEICFRNRMAKYGVNVDQTYDYALPYLRQFKSFAREDYPRALQAAREIINLPNYPGLSLDDARFVAQCVKNCIMETSRKKKCSVVTS